ncbi:ABC transporter ATP-binding protein [Brachymonas sp. G13]|uniref:ABC transporter ATP-binding protein n=1 Tax=Brachymonas wangyanguii TaxID=3130163 RepID=UPI0016AA7363|nr:ABC transporter ATP-binding protein [Ramlibacter sp.]
MHLSLDQVSIRYPGQPVDAVHQVSFGLAAADIGVLLGPSGCGKTTLLRAVAGLEPLAGGTLTLAGQTLSRPGQTTPPEQRQMGMVFQDYALFPHLSVERNIAYGLHGQPAERQRQRTQEVLELVGLADLGKRYPHELSGGQQQRVALARALAPDPRLLLLDEPFSNLDINLRERLAQELRALLKQTGTTTLLVTHDQQEAFAMGDRIGVLDQGRMQQWADARTLYDAPATPFVARFIGHGMLLPVQADAAGKLQSALGELPGQHAANSRQLLLRSHDLQYDPTAPVHARLLGSSYQGSHQIYTLELADGTTVQATMPAGLQHVAGEMIGVRLQQDRELVVFAG